jgi:hypothetical protein
MLGFSPLSTNPLSTLPAASGGGGAVNYTLSGAVGSYAITGRVATFKVAHTLSGAVGSYAITGKAGAFSYVPGAGSVAYSLSGAAGSYAITGRAATFKVAHALFGTVGSYVITGRAGTLTYTAGNTQVNYTLTGASGSYGLTGNNGAFNWSGASSSFSNEIELKRKFYVRRGKQIHLFNSAQDADAWIDAENEANEAVAQAQKTSRLARKRLKAKVFSPSILPVETVQIDALGQLAERYNLNADIPALLAAQDYAMVVKMMQIARDIQDEEDIEMLLLM